MTDLQLRQDLTTLLTTATTAGTADNTVAKTYFWQPDQIAFSATPALVITAPQDDEVILDFNSTEATVQIECDYLDAPLEGDDVTDPNVGPMAALEAWFEQAKANIRANPDGLINGSRSWLVIERFRTRIDRPLKDEGRVLYYGCLTVWIKTVLELTT